MATSPSTVSTPERPLRLWPGVVAAVLLVLLGLGIPAVVPDGHILGILSALALAVVILVWWLFFSRAPWSERLGAIALMIVALLLTSHVVHVSIRTGHMGATLPLYGTPVLCLALVAWAVASRRLATGQRRAALVVAILLACGVFTLVRTDGITGEGASLLAWRWTPTPEERLLAKDRGKTALPPPAPAAAATLEPPPPAPPSKDAAPLASAPAATKAPEQPVAPAGDKPATLAPASATAETGAEWPGFRGPGRDGVVPGLRIKTDWVASPPVELWRRPIGPGWSSFAIRSDLAYTQEQRGDDEVVSCYKLTTGEPVWRHGDPIRFWESNAGAGPRGTPTLSHGRVYAFGATGILNALDAGKGSVVWSRNVASDTGVKIPDWGFSSSPLVVGDVVIVAASGRLAAYDVATGDVRWLGPDGGAGYSSPHLMTIDGVPQILLLRGSRSTSVAPPDGSLLWEHRWQLSVSIVQPAMVTSSDLLVNSADASGGLGTRRLAVAHGAGGWTVEERWTTTGLKPYFNDYVVHKGHAFGFDGGILACIDVEDGKRKWKGGRYGHGQLVLLSDQDLLLVLSEEGELALVGATPDQFKELAKFPAIEGKTWNHPALAGDVLLVRNDQEMAAFRLPLAGR
jgi:outer membrane protein assembly factor BamB